MSKKYFLLFFLYVSSFFCGAQTDSLAGFDLNDGLEHAKHMHKTPAETRAFIDNAKRNYIERKYNLDKPVISNINGKLGHSAMPTSLNCATDNYGFENGTTSGWTLSGACGLVSGGTDVYGGFPKVCPSGGNYSLKLSNDSSGGCCTSSASKSISVPAGTTYFTFYFALAIFNYPHTASDAATFSVDFYDQTGTLISCPKYLCYHSTDNGDVGMSNISATTYSAQYYNPGAAGDISYNSNVTYAPWQSIQTNLSPYAGTTITAVFTAKWCIYNVDWLYAYIDADCINNNNQIVQSNTLCAGGSTTLSGPSGMSSYNWTGPVSGTTQNLTTSAPGNYTLTTTANSSCGISNDTLYYTLTQAATAAPVVSIAASNDTICRAATTTLTASGANTYNWSNGAITNSISVSPLVSTTYTLTGTDTTTGCVGSANQLIDVNGVSITASNNPLCTGSATLTASGASTYTWSSNAGSATTNTVAVSPTSNTTYTVSATDASNTCTSTASILVSMASTLTINNPHDSICIGTSVNLTASGATSYSWSTGATSSAVTVTPTITTTYTVTGTGSCVGTRTTSIYVKPSPTVNINSTPPRCEGVPSVLTASGANTYVWSTGQTTQSITVTPTSTTSYTVTGTTNTCTNQAVVSVIVPVNVAPLICMATTDSSTSFIYNYLIWDKTPYTNVDSFIIYRLDALSSVYLRIGAVSKSALSEFKDTAFSIGGPNGGNPQYSSWYYKMAIKDTCGNISAQSPYHQTMFVQQSGPNFTWNAYNIEAGQANPVTGYSLLRDDNSTGNWHVLVNTAATSATDPSYASYPNGNWRVDALTFNCTPTLRLAANSTQTVNKRSKSNTIKVSASGINQLTNIESQLILYPNPVNEKLNINCKIKNATLYITNMWGEKIMQVNVNSEVTSVDLSSLSNGVYFLNTSTSKGQITKKFVVQR